MLHQVPPRTTLSVMTEADRALPLPVRGAAIGILSEKAPPSLASTGE